MKVWDTFIVMVVNRDGFLVLGAGLEETDMLLYRVADSVLWDPYTIESFFLWEDKPSVLLYRNDFFSEPSAPPPVSPVYALSESSSVPLPVSIPALESFLPPWEVEVLRRGLDGFWYYRVKEKGRAQNETAFFRTADLTEEGIRVSVGEWRNSEPRDSSSPDEGVDLGPYPLPALPEGFVYSGLAILGNVLAASWEEQLDAGIGAAGFMVMALGANAF
jgi:hypothetical protein